MPEEDGGWKMEDGTPLPSSILHPAGGESNAETRRTQRDAKEKTFFTLRFLCVLCV
jgi:hypothetical protein